MTRQGKYIDALRRTGATSREHAKSKDELRVMPIGAFIRMERAGVIMRTPEDKYFLNEEKAESYIRSQNRLAWIMLFTTAAWVLAAYLLNRIL